MATPIDADEDPQELAEGDATDRPPPPPAKPRKTPKSTSSLVKAPKSKVRANARASAVAAVWESVSRLKRWKDNPRQNKEAVPKVARSIRRFGFGAPLLARKSNREVLAGDTRFQAVDLLARWWAKDQHSDKKRKRWHAEAITVATQRIVPVRFLNLSEKEAHALAVADNKTGEAADWDDELLKDQMAALEEEDADLVEATGFDEDELEKLLADEDEDEDDGDDEDDEDDADAQDRGGYKVVITCKNEKHQTELLERLGEEGLDVRALIG